MKDRPLVCILECHISLPEVIFYVSWEPFGLQYEYQLADSQWEMSYKNLLFQKEGSRPYNILYLADRPTVLIYDDSLAVFNPITA